MKISTRGRYAVRLMMDIATCKNEGAVSLKDIAERQNVSLKYLERIAKQLVSAQLLESHRGMSGGYSLVKKPEEYTVGEILRATEGSLAPVACLDDEHVNCKNNGCCPSLKVWEGLYRVIVDYLDSAVITEEGIHTTDVSVCD